MDFLDPRKPISPAEAQESAFPLVSVMVTIVLLKDERICAEPFSIFLRSRRFLVTAFFVVTFAILSLVTPSYMTLVMLNIGYFVLLAMVFAGPLRVLALVLER